MHLRACITIPRISTRAEKSGQSRHFACALTRSVICVGICGSWWMPYSCATNALPARPNRSFEIVRFEIHSLGIETSTCKCASKYFPPSTQRENPQDGDLYTAGYPRNIFALSESPPKVEFFESSRSLVPSCLHEVHSQNTEAFCAKLPQALALNGSRLAQIGPTHSRFRGGIDPVQA
jgi:hypothetical protein